MWQKVVFPFIDTYSSTTLSTNQTLDIAKVLYKVAVCITVIVCVCKGMTDLLAPLLAALDNEVEAFWCFEKLVESSAYFKPAKNSISVEKQLVSDEFKAFCKCVSTLLC